uniref:Uncharacterized protein n=1 Tax=Daphnia galeata TaxID=27404 RepID=A0A8J2RP06_9CRUS|nr:unnamed protein product [Daphnia galeata]
MGAGKTELYIPGRMDSLESMAAESSPLSPELRNRNKRKETTHYQRASLGRYTTYTQSTSFPYRQEGPAEKKEEDVEE